MPFRAALVSLVAKAPSVRGAVFCDFEGERVESVLSDPTLDPFDLDLVGASYAHVVEQLGPETDAQLRVVHPHGVVWVQPVAEGYYILLLARPSARDLMLQAPLRELGRALREIL